MSTAPCSSKFILVNWQSDFTLSAGLTASAQQPLLTLPIVTHRLFIALKKWRHSIESSVLETDLNYVCA